MVEWSGNDPDNEGGPGQRNRSRRKGFKLNAASFLARTARRPHIQTATVSGVPYHWQSPPGNPGGSGSGNNSERKFADISSATTTLVAMVSFWNIVIGEGGAEIV